jgi:hypothetical protein
MDSVQLMVRTVCTTPSGTKYFSNEPHDQITTRLSALVFRRLVQCSTRTLIHERVMCDVSPSRRRSCIATPFFSSQVLQLEQRAPATKCAPQERVAFAPMRLTPNSSIASTSRHLVEPLRLVACVQTGQWVLRRRLKRSHWCGRRVL